MNPAQQLLKGHSRRNTDLLVKWIGCDRKRFTQVFSLMKGKDKVLVQRSSWVVKNSLINNPQWITSCTPDLLKLLKKDDLHEGVVRHILNVFDDGMIPRKFEGEILEHCFGRFTNGKSAIAVKVFSMSIMAKLAKRYGDLRNELVGLIELELEKGAGPAIRSRAKRVLKYLEK